MDTAKIRAWWWHRQGLDGSMEGRAADEVLAATGWARSVGGASPYLGLFARAGLEREAVDAAVAAVRIHELPAARGCTYVVPAADFALALTAGQGHSDQADARLARKLGATDAELERLCEAVVRALARGPMTPEELREAAGSAVRDFGAEGRKKGLASTMPVALARLQSEGKIRRVPVDGRLDRQRYRYAAWRPGPLPKSPPAPESVAVDLARRYFSWAGPATPESFAAFSGFGVRACRAAVEPLGLVPPEDGHPGLMLPADVEAFRAYRPPRKPSYTLVGSLDGLFHLRRDLDPHLDAVDRKRTWFAPSSRKVAGRTLVELPSHAIVDRGRIVGLWEFDPSAGVLAWTSFVPPDSALRAAIARTEAFVRDGLGDARSFSLDSPESRSGRIAALRAASAKAARQKR